MLRASLKRSAAVFILLGGAGLCAGCSDDAAATRPTVTEAGAAEASAEAAVDVASNQSDAASDATLDSADEVALDAQEETDGPPFSALTRDAGSNPDARFAVTQNLLFNGGAEAVAGGGGGPGDGSVLAASVPGWQTTGNASVLAYGAAGGFPQITDPGPPDRGLNFFSGGSNDALSSFSQTVDLSSFAADIAQGHVTFVLSGYLGGYGSQDDNATLAVSFLGGFDAGAEVEPGAPGDASGGGEAEEASSSRDSGLAFDASYGMDADSPPGDADAHGETQTAADAPILATEFIGPVLAAERSNATGLILKSTTGVVPPGSLYASVRLTMTRIEGEQNDGYADSLFLSLAGN